jgi:predicted N-formylglutamate amidohydrolase
MSAQRRAGVMPHEPIRTQPAALGGDHFGPDFVVVTCEHGGNRIPPEYRAPFKDAGAVLRTHRGYDAGALSLARGFADALAAPLHASVVSRLLIDLNRSPGHPKLYSEFTRPLPPALQHELFERHYLPYRSGVERCIADAIAAGRRVLHVSTHSYTPVLDGRERNADIGLLYDPSRAAERRFALCWQAALEDIAGACRTRLNYPYAGRADGFTTYLRKRFAPQHYLGIEIEINQKHVRHGGARWRTLRAAVIESLRSAVAAAAPARAGLVKYPD